VVKTGSILTGALVALAVTVSIAVPDGESSSEGLWVDGAARKCDDSRPAREVSASSPWCTLEQAARAAPDGAVVRVAPGSYGDVTFTGIRRDRPVTLRGEGARRPRLGYTVFDGAAGIRLSGFAFDAPVDVFPGSNGRIGLLGNVFAGFRDVGVNVGPGAHDVLIARNRFEDLRESGEGAPGKGVNASGYGPEVSRLRILDNEFLRTHGGGIAIAGVREGLIEGNLITGVRPAPGSPIHADPLVVQGAEGLVVRRNVFRGNEQAIVVFDGVRGLRFESNTVVGGDNYAVNFQGSAPGLRFLANTLWGNAFGGVLVQGRLGPRARLRNNILQSISGDGEVGGDEDFNLIASGPRGGRHDLGGAPGFVSPRRSDYSLAAGSRAIDAGTSTGTPRADRLGHPRVDDPRVPNRGGGRRPYYDLGAQERGGQAR
jgi:hypothetical protein